ncbi:LLM class flavin-dependent oxidoreductase [Streptosporangiaceae bacterium NEAU-GS5]|nr:LLM class flavin-dependent oxidoreductase [Streptosporangiaceae bacterium NEAU-GS5]
MTHLAVALDGAGRHPAAWRAHGSRPRELFTAGYWTELVLEAERGLLDFVTFEDGLSLQSSWPDGFDGRLDQVRGRLDAVLLAARVAPLTSAIGLVPGTDTRHAEPFHVAIGIASLDHVSRGRAGWRPAVPVRQDEGGHFGRRDDPLVESRLNAEAADFVEVVRRLWDSWEDDAEIRDVATGRFVDRHKLHYIDFEGEWFSVRGPSITPRSPQGQPLVAVSARDVPSYALAGHAADVAFVTPHTRDHAADLVDQVTATADGSGRDVQVFADLVVFLDERPGAAAERKVRLDAWDGGALVSDAYVFTGTPAELADLIEDWRPAGLTGFRLHAGVLPHDLWGITRGLVPELQARGEFRHRYDTADLRGRLGLPRPASRYAISP